MAVKASNQIDLIDLTDGYSVILTSDSHTFIGTTSGVSGTQTATTQVMAFRGDDQIACSVGAITGLPAGLSAVNGGQSPAPTITFTATSALTTKGIVTIPVTIGDLTMHKGWSYAIAFRGTDGQDGTSVSITSTEVKYQTSSSGTITPTDTWLNDPPTPTPGQYLWTRTKVNYSDSKSTTAYSVSRYGTDGQAGSSVTITSTEIRYQKSSSGTQTPTGTWETDPPTPTQGQFLWTRTKVTYSDTTTTTSYSVARYGTDGADGSDGDDAILLSITSSGGTIFKNTAIATTLTAHVFKGGVELTSGQISALGSVKWYKDGGATAVKTGLTLTVTAGDVDDKATYTAQLES
ncbi:MAG: hypothetical protein WC145_12120 [Aliarcobacter sp.]